MTEKQATTFGTVEPVARLGSDVVVCSDGSECEFSEAFTDCRGELHRTEEERHDADVAIVTEVLDGRVAGAEEYATENDDYASAYDCIVDECKHEWPGRVKTWICDSYGDYYGRTDYDDFMDELVAHICDDIYGAGDCDVEYNRSDYSAYSGKGFCLDGFKIGEIEEQIDLECHPELMDLHNAGRLDDILDDYNGEGCVSRNRRRVKNEKTGYYEPVGRETYNTHPDSDFSPTFCMYINVSGGWDYVIPRERMDEMVQEFLDGREDEADCED